MKRFVKKIRENKGASILMALMLLFTGIMVSVVIISAALTASKKVYGQREQQQAYLAVTSAIEFLGKQIETAGIKVAEQITYNRNGVPVSYVAPSASIGAADPDSILIGDILKDMSLEVYKKIVLNGQLIKNPPDEFETDKIVYREFIVEAADMEPVQITLYMNEEYDIKAWLQTKTDSGYQCQMYFFVDNGGEIEPDDDYMGQTGGRRYTYSYTVTLQYLKSNVKVSKEDPGWLD